MAPGERIGGRRRGRTWIVIADGARSKVLATEGAGSGLEPVPEGTLEADHRPTRELGSDRPGRVFESADGTRHAYAPREDWHEQQKHAFAREVAAFLDEALRRKAFDDLVLVAPPKALGDLRAALSDEARKRVREELSKDLTNTPLHDLPSHFEGLVKL